MRKKIVPIVALLAGLSLTQCVDDDAGGESFNIVGQFSGKLSQGFSSSDVEGIFSIDDEESFSLQTLTGELTGKAIEDDDGYGLEVRDGDGDMELVEDGEGNYDMEGQYLELEGTNENGEEFSMSGSVTTAEELDDEYFEGVDMVAVYFTHTESCVANIYLDDNQSIEGLTTHYAMDGLCNSDYDFMFDLRKDVDRRDSELLCHDVTLKQEDGSYKTYTLCETAVFILDKDERYEYTVEWLNGEVTTGDFKTGEGGEQERICISNDGDECEDSVGKSYTYSKGTVSDVDGNSYETVIFGEQEWMAENLITTKFNDGTDIFYATNDDAWENAGCDGWCPNTIESVYGWYDNSSGYKEAYGALYNGYVVEKGNVCPSGWRVPSDEDWKILEKELGMPEDELNGYSYADRGSDYEIAQQLRETGFEYWEVSGFDAEGDEGTDDIEFGARPGGQRNRFGASSDLGENANFWTSTLATGSYDDQYYVRKLHYFNSGVSRHPIAGDKNYGYSIRCMRDN